MIDQQEKQPFITSGYLAGFILVTSLFFLWAVANNFNDILIRQFQKALDLNRAEAGFIQFVFYLGYFLMALPAGMLMRRFGYRAGILAGLGLYAAGAFLFYPAAELRVYGAFLAALFVIASGAAFLETAANPYIIAFGAPDRAPQRLNLAQSFNGFGAFLAPILGGLFIFSGVEHSADAIGNMSPQMLDAYRASEARMVQLPYVTLGLVVLLIAGAIAFVRLPTLAQRQDEETPATLMTVARNKRVRRAVFAQFFYVGAQVGIWSFFVDFVKDTDPSISEKAAAFLLSGSLVLFMIGRFAGTALMHKVRPVTLLQRFAIINILLCALAVLLSGPGAIAALVATSFFMSIMFPTIFALGVRDLGPDAPLGSSLLIMAIIGGAIFPPIMGGIDTMLGGIHLSMLAPMLCFAVVAFYAAQEARQS